MSFVDWSRYFESIAEFLQGASRQYGVANENFTEYVVERLDLCISTCTTLRDQLIVNVNEEEEEEAELIMRYRAEMEGLLDCLMKVQVEWKRYREVLDARVQVGDDFSFHVGTTVNLGRGRPRFNVSKEQLEYLSSLGFSWTEVASIFGVSRMTIYRLGMLCYHQY